MDTLGVTLRCVRYNFCLFVDVSLPATNIFIYVLQQNLTYVFMFYNKILFIYLFIDLCSTTESHLFIYLCFTTESYLFMFYNRIFALLLHTVQLKRYWKRRKRQVLLL